MTIKLPKKGEKAEWIRPFDVDGDTSKYNTPDVKPVTIPPITVNPVSTNAEFWTIPNVSYRGISTSVEVLKSLLDNKKCRTQDDWASYSEQARTNGDFYVPDYPLFYATLEKMFDLRDSIDYKQQVEEMRTTLQSLSRANWLMTLTRVQYSPKGKDNIIHNYGLGDKYELQESFVGEDGELPAKSSENVYQSFLGTGNSVNKIKDVFQWLNETPTYIWRLNSKPKQLDERVARFGANSGRAYLYCNGGPTSTDSSLGVRAIRRGSP